MPDDRRVLEGITRLVVDGTNVLFALGRTADPLPAAALIGRLRAIVPPGVEVVVVLDGSPEHGLVSRHVASGVEVKYSGRFTADEVIARLAERELGPDTAGLLVVTDDIGLSALVRRSGGRTARNGWLIDRLGRQRLSAPSAGRPGMGPAPAPGGPAGGGRATGGRAGGPGGAAGATGGRATGIGSGRSSSPDSAPDPDADEGRWEPGRGATRKRGNGRRVPRAER